ncbi:hypothetical protein SAMD00019534_049040 [Acytostelium subglobosum LB1]|uniref:hypothetical protein n=1 Tax=Acytostelium subglobosum LB1 TaxID=1410327 RepID=UPI000644BD6F|nr:hypothetical protein SAMD00019534_049040 [Acytostelium subglobosum LB1]GAM21729.1 hypothetical protein SAMD00019534_049040 [Acytostelium subglobosum LB1]|eukprot:XP_012754829.1 hypothetical protein SAMD00019534_049040 [Acytostelium subglobosum LB1]
MDKINLTKEEYDLVEKVYDMFKKGQQVDKATLEKVVHMQKSVQLLKPPYKNNLMSQFSTGMSQPLSETPQKSYSTVKQVIERMEQLKKLGNDAFTREEYWFSVSYYTMALRCFDKHSMSLANADAQEVKEMRKLAAIISTNLSLSYVKQDYIQESATVAEKAIAYDETNAKAFFRSGYALQRLGMVDKATAHYQHGLRLATSSKNNALHGQIKKELDHVFLQQRQNAANRIHTRTRIANDTSFSAFPVSLVWDPVKGRTLSANKDVPKGALILRVAPFGAALIDETLSTHCSSCFRNISFCKHVHCSKCKMNTMCEACNSDKTIAEEHANECDLLAFLHKHTPNAQTTDFRFMIRVLLRAVQHLEGKANKQSTPESWRKDGAPFIYDTLDDLDHLSDVPSNIDEKKMEAFTTATGAITRVFDMVKGPTFLAQLGKQHILDLYSKILFNAHEYIDPLHQTAVARGIFPTGAYLNHSCQPNCIWYTDNNGMLAYRSTRVIKAGEEIVTSYLDITMDRSKRINRLLEQYAFYCTCSRCSADDNEYHCPDCREPLSTKHLKIWEPQPSINFDGRVHQCSKGHATMSAMFEVLQEMSHNLPIFGKGPVIDIGLRSFFQDGSMMVLNHYSSRATQAMENGLYDLVPTTMDRLWQCYKDAFKDPRDLIPYRYVGDCVQVLFPLAKRDKSIPIMGQVKEKCRATLELQIQLSTHHILCEFEQLFTIK